MNRVYRNALDIPLSIAVYLANDTYDYDDDPLTISTTSLIKPLRKLILSSRVAPSEVFVDIKDLVNSRMGTSIHKGVEDAWLENYRTSMAKLGYPKKIIDRVVVNPDPDTVTADQVPVYLEQRKYRKVGKYTISGKYDFVGDGQLEDIKTTGVFTAMYDTNDRDYQLQGSIYRWLNEKIITKDTIKIQWIFTDWSKAQARTNPKYPQHRHLEKIIPLMPVAATDRWIKKRVADIEKYWDAPEEELPECSDDELWRSDPVYKYYKDPSKVGGRSTKNFTDEHDAKVHRATQGVGIIVTVPGTVKACLYCDGLSICSQAQRMIASGELVLDTA